jgi:hypothetical protein
MTDPHATHDDPNVAKKNADAARKDNDKRAAEAQKKADEARSKARELGDKQREDERKQADEAREAARKFMAAKAKEDARRAALTPPERVAEDDKRAAMTPEEREKDDESKGLTKPEQFDQINLLAGTPQFTVQTELPHSAEFVLSEAAGHGSRDNATVAIGDSLKVGQTIKIVTPATLTVPAVVTGNVTTDTAADGVALYAVPVSTVAQQVAVISRNAEVNGNLLYFPGTITGADKNNIAKALAVHNIMARF